MKVSKEFREQQLSKSSTLLQHDYVNDTKSVELMLNSKTILITGAAGSIGFELVKQIIEYKPKKVILLDINENGLQDVKQQLNFIMRAKGYNKITVDYVLANIQDYYSLVKLFEKNEIDIIFHSAAYKHVSLMEAYPAEAIKNNVLATNNLIVLAGKYLVDKFVNLSTEKAFSPSNIMGATKRFNEINILKQNNKTKFTSIRFGNVLGSSGSVAEIFKSQIENGGPLSVTHKDITRYFISVSRVTTLILEAAAMSLGEEIFILDRGEPVKILELAKKLIKDAKLVPYKDIDIEVVGLRPGEVIVEEIGHGDQIIASTSSKYISLVKETSNNEFDAQTYIDKFEMAIKNNVSNQKLINILDMALSNI